MTVLDERYYAKVPAKSVAERLLISARDRIFADFMTRMRPLASDTVLDVGVSDVINDGANVLERSYPYPCNIVACGLSDAHHFRAEFPEIGYRRIVPNAPLPFANKSFDIATSNAVLEHVGSFDNQMLFVSELCRVARRVFITVPNKFFPVEHHTALPFVHYQSHTFQLACHLSGQTSWTNEEALILMTRKRLWRLASAQNLSATVGYTGLQLGPFSSNLFLALD